MSEMEYTYAVARIRALEVSLFSQSTIDALMACKTSQAALNLIVEKGWGGMDVPEEADAILAAERSKDLDDDPRAWRSHGYFRCTVLSQCLSQSENGCQGIISECEKGRMLL